MLLVAVVPAVAVAPRPFAEERLLLDRRLKTLRRILHQTSDRPSPSKSPAPAVGESIRTLRPLPTPHQP
jgi:hypothetical protein